MKKNELFKVLSSEVRLNILKMLLRDRLCVSKIVKRLDLAQPTITQHLKMLQYHGLIKSEKIGYWVHYSADRKGIEKCKKELLDFLNTLEFTSSKNENKCTLPRCISEKRRKKINPVEKNDNGSSKLK